MSHSSKYPESRAQNQKERYCILIPSYNHIQALPLVLDELFPYGYPCIVVNDGSTDNTREVLEEVSSHQPLLEVVNFSENRGKGAAVLAGIERASSNGYTHVVCIDADGQHDIRDLKKFVDKSVDNPEAIVIGDPIFGSDIPIERLLSRQLSKILVWFHCLSFAVVDPLCGYRLFPLKEMKEIFETQIFEMGMAFDTENIVKAYWAGVKIINLKTEVRYPLDGQSHFKYVKDVIAIAQLHIKLTLLMLVLPYFYIKQKINEKKSYS